ncbi:MAG: universal stress protein [Spirochaetes bacterium]|nr:universal stress protein [Spirochaetota bacterium]
MNIKKILYVSNADKHISHKKIFENLSVAFDSGKAGILALLSDPNSVSKNELSADNADIKILNENISYKSILKITGQNDIDLILFSTNENNTADLLTALKKIIRKTVFPVIFLNGQDVKDMFRHPVIAMNRSVESDKALNFLVDCKKNINELEIINVINKKLTVKDIRELKELLSSRRKLCLDQGINAESHIYAGETADEILLSAKDYKASLIVMGRSDKNKKIFNGKSALQVCQNSKLPVLIA